MTNKRVDRKRINEAHEDIVTLKAVAHVRTDRPKDPTMLDILTAIRGVPHVITVKQEGSTRPAPNNHQRAIVSITFDDDHKYDVIDLERAAAKIPGVRLFKVIEYEGKPYKDRQVTKNVRIRRFSERAHDDDLVWHRDERDRTITVLEGRGWQFQRDNELPQEMRPGQVIEVRAGEWHRIVKGAAGLRVIILENRGIISEQAQQGELDFIDKDEELKVEPQKQKAVPTRFEVKWNDDSFEGVRSDTPLGIARDPKKDLTHKDNEDEKAVVQALNILTTGDLQATIIKPWKHEGGQKPYDIELKKEATLDGFSFPAGKYEIKSKLKGGELSRLGPAKSVSVRTVPALSALVNIGSSFGNFKRSLGSTGEIPEILRGPSKVMNDNWKNLTSLSLIKQIMDGLKNGTMENELKSLRKALFSYISGTSTKEEDDGKVTIRAELPPEERDGKADYEAEIDLDLFATRVKPYLTQKGKVNFSDGMTEEQYEALVEFHSALARGLNGFPSADEWKDLFDNLAKDTQTGTVEGIFGWGKTSFQFYKFQELTVKTITNGRLVLEPKTKSDD